MYTRFGRLGLSLVLLAHNIVLGSSSTNDRLQPLKAPMFWGSWSQWSACSSQCGEGVETKTRECLRWSPGGYTTRGFAWQCEGYGNRKRLCYGKCENGPTPPSTDECFGMNYNYPDENLQLEREWVEVKRGFPCEVVCRSIYKKGSRTISLKKNGTPCQAYGVSNGECFAGQCQSVDEGCRDSYGRPLQVDMCMKCGGINATCQPREGTFRTIVRNSGLSAMPMVVRVPEGSTSIEITKYGRAMNSLALIDSSGRFVINEKRWPSKQGDYKIDGVTWVYRQRYNQESMTSRGPIVAPITIKLTTKRERQVVHYSLWVPNGVSLETENYEYFNDNNFTDLYALGNGADSRASNYETDTTDFSKPLELKKKPQLLRNTNSRGETARSKRPDYYPGGSSNRNIGNRDDPRTPPDIQSFDNSANRPIKTRPSDPRGVDDESFDMETEPSPVLGIDTARTIIIKLDDDNNEPESTLDESGASTIQLGGEKEPTYLAPSSDELKPSSEEDEGIWSFVESELKKQGEDYIWELVEWQLRMRREEAIWELVEEELKKHGEEAIWELVEEGLRKLHETNGHTTSKNGENIAETINPSINGGNKPDFVILPGLETDDDDLVTIIDTETEKERNSMEPVKSGSSRENDNRTRRVNVTLRELLLEDNKTPRVRPRQSVKRPYRPRKTGAPKRPRPNKKRRKKKGKWRPNDIYISLKPNEHCFPCIRPKDKVRQFCTSDFVSKVHVNRRKVIGNETRYDVTILSSYRNRVRLLPREYIWMESTCRCPRVKTKRTYIVMGRMQSLSDRQTRLVITPKSYIRGFSLGFDRKIRELTRTIRCPDKG